MISVLALIDFLFAEQLMTLRWAQTPERKKLFYQLKKRERTDSRLNTEYEKKCELLCLDELLNLRGLFKLI